MPAITITDLLNAGQDVGTIGAIANSTAPTVTDRLGQVRPTLAALAAEFPAASANAAAALASKNAAAVSVTDAGTAAATATAAKVAAEAARDSAMSASQAAQLSSSYSTVALGLAGTTNGKYFGVKQAYGDAIDVYLNSSGAAVYQQTRPFGAGDQYEATQIAERILAPFPYTPVFSLHGIDQYDRNGEYFKNRVWTGPVSGNVFKYNTGWIPNVTTQAYATGPGGSQTACRVTVVNFYKAIAATIIPSGACTARLKVKSNAGAGALNFHIGQYTKDMQVVSCVEATWTTVTWAVDGAAGYQVFIDSRAGTTTSIDILIDEVQFYSGASIPVAFSAEPRDTNTIFHSAIPVGRRAPNDARRSGGAIDTTGNSKMSLQLPSFPADTTLTEGTCIACFSTTDTSLIAAKIFSTLGNEGEFDIGIDAGNLFGGPAMTRNNSWKGLNVAGKGYQIIASRFKAGEQAMFFRKLKIATNSNTLTTTKKSIGFCCDNITAAGSPDSFYVKAKITSAVWFDKWLSDDQIKAMVDGLKTRNTLYGEPPVAPMNFWIAEGDSITEQSGGGAGPYPVQFFATFRATWFGKNIAVSGSAHANAVARMPTVVDWCQSVVADGGRPIVSYFMGANGLPTQQQITDYGTAVRNAGGKFVMCTVLPKGSDATWETSRLAYNTMLRGNPGLYDGLADFGADSLIGVFGAPTARVYYYDDIHLNATGEARALAVIQPVLLALGI